MLKKILYTRDQRAKEHMHNGLFDLNLIEISQ